MIRMTGDQWRLSHTHTYTLQPLMHVMEGKYGWMEGRKGGEDIDHSRFISALFLSIFLCCSFNDLQDIFISA